MLHEPAAASAPDNASEYKASLGVKLFIVYALFYAGFVAINVLKPILMEKVVFLNLNLAVVYGFGLIIVALILALIYNKMCEIKEEELNGPESGKAGE